MHLLRLLLTTLVLGATPALAEPEDAPEAEPDAPALDGESSRAAVRALVEAARGP